MSHGFTVVLYSPAGSFLQAASSIFTDARVAEFDETLRRLKAGRLSRVSVEGGQFQSKGSKYGPQCSPYLFLPCLGGV